MGQRQLLREMGADEIVDWMAYMVSVNPDFQEKLAKTPVAYETAEDEATALKRLLGWSGGN